MFTLKDVEQYFEVWWDAFRIKYGDIDIRTNVKVVKATNDIAEAEYMNVAQSTVNKLLYLSLITEEQLNSRGIPATIGNRNAISYEN